MVRGRVGQRRDSGTAADPGLSGAAARSCRPYAKDAGGWIPACREKTVPGRFAAE
ncbi:MAG: hypothetical protein AVDCRST_MAG51-643 [uncultured Ramlibacter sp.]|uniref:Uncharacterized protein n=1 Tax=uncultured Ramlibacter sp. TaxID=260755 RepID=A0A6J4NZH1_9BURK|nr:MAG: hypothetical protein AVDCRST_MAG51-643 [uncultured Ramlibacter sp.]